jgi:protoheme IX farnesyltransferase
VSKNHYLTLTKPGIIFGNLITTIGGFYLAKPHASFLLLLFTLLGISLVIASGCVFNNFIDRDIDQLMERTKYRPSAQGLISAKTLLYFASVLGIFGIGILFFFTNLLAMCVAIIGLIFYVVFYSLYFKRTSIFGTAIGSISGAVPPVVGYCAASGKFDSGAVILLLILVFWQMPHSYAIAIYRLKDYIAAAIPVLPVKKSLRHTKLTMLVHTIIFAIFSLLPTFFGYEGFYYLGVAIVLSTYWIYVVATGFKAADDNQWAKRVFLFSIIVITVLSIMMVIN